MAEISHWKFENDATDEHGTNDGTNQGAAFEPSGHDGGCYDFTRGDDDRIEAQNKPDASVLGSISAWIKLDDVTNGVTKTVFGYGGGAHASAGLLNFRIECDGSNGRAVIITRGDDNTPAIAAVRGANSMVAGTWYHVVLTSSGTGWKLYLDSVEDTNAYIGSNVGDWLGDIDASEVDYWSIGSLMFDGGLTNSYDGLIDDVRLYDHELSQSEVNALYSIARFRRRMEG